MKLSSACFAPVSCSRAMPWAEEPWTTCVVFGSLAALLIVITAVFAAMSLPPAMNNFGPTTFEMTAKDFDPERDIDILFLDRPQDLDSGKGG